MKNLDDLQEAILQDDDLMAHKIMQDLYMRWFAFGLGIGIVVTSIVLGLVIINK